MLGRAIRGRHAQWWLRQVNLNRTLFSIAGNKCSPNSIVPYQNAAPLNHSSHRHVFGGSFRSLADAATASAEEIAPVDDPALGDQHFIEYDLEYPLFPPDAADAYKEAVELIWAKGGGDDGKEFLQAVKETDPVTRELINRLLIRLLSRQRNAEAYLVMQWVVRKRLYEITEQDVLTLMYVASIRVNFSDKCSRIIRRLGEKTGPAYEIFLRSYANSNKVDSTESVMEKMKEGKLINTAGPYNHTISMFLRLGNAAKAKEYLDELQASEVNPDAFTYMTLLEHRGLLQQEDVVDVKQRAEALLAKFGDGNGAKGQEWRDTIRLYAEMGKATHVTRLWENLVDGRKYVPDIYYFAAAEAFYNVQDVDKFEQLCKEVATRRQKITEEQCHFMIRVYSRGGRQMGKAENVLKTARENGLDMGFPVYHLLISGYMSKRNKVNAAKAGLKFQEFLDLHPAKRIGKRTKSAKYTCQYRADMLTAVPLVMDAYGLTGDVNKAEALVKMVRASKKYPIDVGLFNSLLRAYGRNQTGMYSIQTRMKDFAGAPDDETNRLLKRVYPLVGPEV